MAFIAPKNKLLFYCSQEEINPVLTKLEENLISVCKDYMLKAKFDIVEVHVSAYIYKCTTFTHDNYCIIVNCSFFSRKVMLTEWYHGWRHLLKKSKMV